MINKINNSKGKKMKNKKNILVSLLVSLFLILSMINTVIAGNKVLFYENKISGDYKTTYSQFKEELRRSGYIVEPLEVELSKEALALRNPDVIVIPSLGSDLTPDEMTTLFESVTKDGKGLFICGATPSVNKLTIPLGMTVDAYTLEDESNQIRDMSTNELIKDKTAFYIDLPISREDPIIRELTNGVNKIYLFGGNGIYVFGNAKAVITGDADTHSPKSLRFPKGSRPPVAACARIGKGSVFLLSDPDMLHNKYLDTSKYRHNNLKFAINIVDWLSIPYEPVGTLEEFEITIKILKDNITELDRRVNNLQTEKEGFNNQINQLTTDLQSEKQKVADLQKDRFPWLPWFTYTQWAMILLAISFLVLAAVIAKRVKKLERKEEVEPSSLGYEFEEKPSEEGEEPGAVVKGEDIEDRLKEFKEGAE